MFLYEPATGWRTCQAPCGRLRTEEMCLTRRRKKHARLRSLHIYDEPNSRNDADPLPGARPEASVLLSFCVQRSSDNHFRPRAHTGRRLVSQTIIGRAYIKLKTRVLFNTECLLVATACTILQIRITATDTHSLRRTHVVILIYVVLKPRDLNQSCGGPGRCQKKM
jgi:hypothetical protein